MTVHIMQNAKPIGCSHAVLYCYCSSNHLSSKSHYSSSSITNKSSVHHLREAGIIAISWPHLAGVEPHRVCYPQMVQPRSEAGLRTETNGFGQTVQPMPLGIAIPGHYSTANGNNEGNQQYKTTWSDMVSTCLKWV